MESFRQWLRSQDRPAHEVSTSTGDIAHFARPVIPGFAYRRMYQPLMTMKIASEEKKK